MVWSPLHDGRFYLVLAAGLAGLLILAFRFATAQSARSPALLVLRALALGVLILILLNPTRVERERLTGPPPTALFLLDESRSMSLESPISRLDAASRLIDRAEGLLPADRRPAIQQYGFGASCSRSPGRGRPAVPRPMVHGWGGPWSSSRRGSPTPCHSAYSSSPTAGQPSRRRSTRRPAPIASWACRFTSSPSATSGSRAMSPCRESTRPGRHGRGRGSRSG